jgi:hypothetical protein
LNRELEIDEISISNLPVPIPSNSPSSGKRPAISVDLGESETFSTKFVPLELEEPSLELPPSKGRRQGRPAHGREASGGRGLVQRGRMDVLEDLPPELEEERRPWRR